MCLLVWAAFWDQDVGLKMSFDNTKPMKINLRHYFKRPFYRVAIKGSLTKCFIFQPFLEIAKDLSSIIYVRQLKLEQA
jgi:hypothetical protein